jgi:hypothetical protein
VSRRVEIALLSDPWGPNNHSRQVTGISEQLIDICSAIALFLLVSDTIQKFPCLVHNMDTFEITFSSPETEHQFQDPSFVSLVCPSRTIK